MPLNGEEKYRHKKWSKENSLITMSVEEHNKLHDQVDERDQYARPTKDQLEIASLEEELNVTRNLNDQLEDLVDKQKYQLDQINGAIGLFLKGDRFEGVTLDTIINAMGWKR